MKSRYSIHTLFVQGLLLALLCIAFPSFGGSNYKDPSGLRQGYWVITGEMSGDKLFAPTAKVEEGHYKDDLREGVWKKYWPNGHLRSEITYMMGKPHGPYKIYYQGGNSEEQGTWDDGVNTGEFKRYYENGQLRQHFFFNGLGKRNGTQYYFHENGQPAVVVEIVNGMESGTMKRFNDQGQLIEEKIFEKGQIQKNIVLHKEKMVNEEPKADAHNPNIGKTAPQAKGAPNHAVQFNANGFNTLYDANGNIIQSGEFKGGKLYTGKWYRYNTSGILVKVDLYQKGKYIGEGIEESK